MKLYLIRHGETVDNIAGIYAGVRDSALTVHGVEQINLLGEHLARTGVRLTHIFSSPLTRALKTAEATQRAQSASHGLAAEVVKVQDLIEQDFGYYEGKPFYARTEVKKSGKDSHREQHKHEPDFVDAESNESLARRADGFLETHLIPLLAIDASSDELAVAVVSHGILLGHLWRRLLHRLPRKSLSISPEVTSARGSVILEHLGGWSNTGYLELRLTKELGDGNTQTSSSLVDGTDDKVNTPSGTQARSVPPSTEPNAINFGPSEERERVSTYPAKSEEAMTKLDRWSTLIVAVDSRQHLVGLKRQRGGIGRLRYDEGQQKLDSFFKRQRKP